MRILEAIEQCRNKQLSLSALEDTITNHLSALDATYPKELLTKLDYVVSSAFQKMTEFLDDPNEDEEVDKVLGTIANELNLAINS